MIALLLALSIGCGSMVVEGRKIDSARLKQLEPGASQAQKVEELFGKPDKVENLPSGEQKYVYSYAMKSRPWFTSDQVDNQRLEVTVKDGIVQNYRLQTQGKETILKE
jgi:outer membrane protein assembly factor BamE (lipoprotein component of BamABCDE complex)